jgi:hypothetical protein
MPDDISPFERRCERALVWCGVTLGWISALGLVGMVIYHGLFR